jgi:hypothetical protein
VLLFLGIDNVEKGPGPKSKHARERDASIDQEHEDSNDLEKAKQSSDASTMQTGHPPQTDDSPLSAPVAERPPTLPEMSR